MKSIRFLLALVMILAIRLAGQAQDVRFGLVTGFDLVNCDLISIADSQLPAYGSPMIAFNVNGLVECKGPGSWRISFEPGFIQKGGIHKGWEDTVTCRLNYIHLPVLAEYYLSDKWFVSFGPELGYLILGRFSSGDQSNEMTDLLDSRFELSGLVGLNFRVANHFDVGLRYNHGLTPNSTFIYLDDQGQEIGKSREYNQYFQAVLRFKI